MSEKEQLLELYKEFSETGWMDEYGLCTVIEKRESLRKSSKNLQYFEPNKQESKELEKSGCFEAFWGCENYIDDYLGYDDYPFKGFTELRQTILAFLIAMAED